MAAASLGSGGKGSRVPWWAGSPVTDQNRMSMYC